MRNPIHTANATITTNDENWSYKNSRSLHTWQWQRWVCAHVVRQVSGSEMVSSVSTTKSNVQEKRERERWVHKQPTTITYRVWSEFHYHNPSSSFLFGLHHLQIHIIIIVILIDIVTLNWSLSNAYSYNVMSFDLSWSWLYMFVRLRMRASESNWTTHSQHSLFLCMWLNLTVFWLFYAHSHAQSFYLLHSHSLKIPNNQWRNTRR